MTMGDDQDPEDNPVAVQAIYLQNSVPGHIAGTGEWDGRSPLPQCTLEDGPASLGSFPGVVAVILVEAML